MVTDFVLIVSFRHHVTRSNNQYWLTYTDKVITIIISITINLKPKATDATYNYYELIDCSFVTVMILNKIMVVCYVKNEEFITVIQKYVKVTIKFLGPWDRKVVEMAAVKIAISWEDF